MVRIPLRNRAREVIAHALVDDCDGHLAEHIWGFDGRYARRNEYFKGGKGKHRKVYLHRVILGLEPGDVRWGDHVNGDRFDYRRDNLRAVSRPANAQNVASAVGSSSRFRGVSWDRTSESWAAYASLGPRGASRKHHLGRFSDEEEAAAAASAFRAEHMPFSVEGRAA